MALTAHSIFNFQTELWLCSSLVSQSSVFGNEKNYTHSDSILKLIYSLRAIFSQRLTQYFKRKTKFRFSKTFRTRECSAIKVVPLDWKCNVDSGSDVVLIASFVLQFVVFSASTASAVVSLIWPVFCCCHALDCCC